MNKHQWEELKRLFPGIIPEPTRIRRSSPGQWRIPMQFQEMPAKETSNQPGGESWYESWSVSTKKVSG